MNDSANKIIEFGPFKLDRSERVLLRDGRPVPLTLKAFEVLLLLVENRGHVVGKDRLMNHVWTGTFVEEGNVKATVSMLRKALEDNHGENRFIETVPRRGYRFVAEVRDVAAEHIDVVLYERTRASVSIDDVKEIAAPSKRNQLLYLLAAALFIVLVIPGGFLLLRNRTQSFAPATETASISSIAVLPFKPLDANSRDESLELGLTDTLITKLSRQKQVIIRPYSAVRKYISLEQDALAAGREQEVDAVLDGSIQKSGDTIRVSARLVSTADGRQLWSDQFDEKLTDILRVQDSISRQVADAITQLTGIDKEVFSRRDTDDAEAYSLYVKGRYFWNKRTAEGLRTSIDYFNQAIARDPNYALAYAGLADAYMVLPGHDNVSMSETHPKATAYAQKALAINNQLPEPHVTLASIAADYWQWEEADRQFKRALDLNPNYATAHQWYGEYFTHIGQLESALAELRVAQQLDPTSVIINALVGQTLYLMRRHDESIEQLQKTLEMDPGFAVAHWMLGMNYQQRGMHQLAKSEFEKAVSTSGGAPNLLALLGTAQARSGNKNEAMTVLARLQVLLKEKRASSQDMAIFYTGLGENDRAFEWLEKALQERSWVVLYLKTDPFFDTLRSDSRFADLVRRVGLPS